MCGPYVLTYYPKEVLFMQKIPANELLAGLTLAEPVSIHAVVTDSREVKPGCVFVCFPGERVDGHDFAAGAYQNGAAYISPTTRSRASLQTVPSLCRTAPKP